LLAFGSRGPVGKKLYDSPPVEIVIVSTYHDALLEKS